ncbi:MAG: hypothetical protein OXE44_18190 [Nitrospinae bacterium]|nr:hypothetical protein [Nitrospinota bacterium]
MNSESVALIYLDPPFNSKHNYAAPIGSEAAGAEFKDTWTLSDIAVELRGLIANEDPDSTKSSTPPSRIRIAPASSTWRSAFSK